MTEEASPKRPKLEWLELGRGLAAVAVMLCHTEYLTELPPSLLFTQSGGNFGVTFFFLLSGFIIYHVHADDLGNPSRAAHFAWRRVIRIFPTYLFVFAAALFANQFLGSPEYAAHVTAGFMLKNIFLLPSGGLFLSVAWTLRHEMLFYFVFLVAVINIRAGLVLAFAWAATVLGTVLWFGIIDDTARTTWNILSSYLNLYFLAGVAIAMTFRRGHIKSALAFSIISAAAIGSICLLSGAPITIDLMQLMVCPILICLCIFLCVREIQAPRFALFLGAISYPLYLSHIPMMKVARGILKHVGYPPIPEWASLLIVALPICLLAAYCISLIERPMLRRASAIRLSRRPA